MYERVRERVREREREREGEKERERDREKETQRERERLGLAPGFLLSHCICCSKKIKTLGRQITVNLMVASYTRL